MNDKNKKLKKSDLSITLLLIAGILAVINFFSYQLFFRWDLTQNKIYSVSKVTKKTVGELDDIVNIKAYFSSNLPSQVLSLRQEVEDILDEYAAYSNGKIKVEFIDPSGDEELQRELYILGIPQLTFEVYEKDKTQLVNGYMGIAVIFADKIESIPAVKRNTSDLEYQLTTAVKKVTAEEMAKIGFLNTHSTHKTDEDIKTAKARLDEIYQVRNVEINEETGVPADIDTLIIAGPKESFSESEQKAINAFLSRGGALLALVDGVTINDGLIGVKNETGLEDLFMKYGIILNQDLVADKRSGMASFNQGFVTFTTPYSFWPKITGDGLNQDNSAVSNLESIILPWASSIDMDLSILTEEAAKRLMTSTDQAWRVTDNFDLTPNNSNRVQGEQKKFVLGTMVNGWIKNAYPEEAGDLGEGFNARIIVLGDSDFILDSFLSNSPDNLNLFLNLVDTLSFDEDLISIRSKGVSSRPIRELSDSSRAAIRYLNIFGLTFAVVIFGLIRYYLRRRSRFVDDI